MKLLPKYDLACIGGGSAGFNAARLAVANGMRVAIIDGAPQLGGLCILHGCMPSKTLLHVAEVQHLARNAGILGLNIRVGAPNLKKVIARKRKIIREFAAHREEALAGGGFDLIRASARFAGPDRIILSDGRCLRSKFFLVGTGSKVSVPPIEGLADSQCWTSDDVLDAEKLPKSIIVLGGGIVACEMAQYLNRMGTRVTLIQRSRRILRGFSEDASDVLQQAFADEGIEILVDTKLESIARVRGGFEVRFQHGNRNCKRRSERVLNAMGRTPNTNGLGLPAAGIETGPKDDIRVDEWQRTSTKHIYAAGDCCGPHEIVHIAISQAELAVRHMLGVKGLSPMDHTMLLKVAFTDPQVAKIDQPQKGEGEILSASYPFNDHGKSILMEAKYGHVQISANRLSGKVTGAEVVGKDAGELIHCFTAAMKLGTTVGEMLHSPWYHPTLSEIMTYPLEELANALPARS